MSTLRDLVGGQGCAPGVNGNPIAALFSQLVDSTRKAEALPGGRLPDVRISPQDRSRVAGRAAVHLRHVFPDAPDAFLDQQVAAFLHSIDAGAEGPSLAEDVKFQEFLRGPPAQADGWAEDFMHQHQQHQQHWLPAPEAGPARWHVPPPQWHSGHGPGPPQQAERDGASTSAASWGDEFAAQQQHMGGASAKAGIGGAPLLEERHVGWVGEFARLDLDGMHGRPPPWPVRGPEGAAEAWSREFAMQQEGQQQHPERLAGTSWAEELTNNAAAGAPARPADGAAWASEFAGQTLASSVATPAEQKAMRGPSPDDPLDDPAAPSWVDDFNRSLVQPTVNAAEGALLALSRQPVPPALAAAAALAAEMRLAPAISNPFAMHPLPMQEGRRLLAEGRIGDASLAFEAAVLAAPDNWEAFWELSQARFELGDAASGLLPLDRASALAPDNDEIALTLAEAAYPAGRPDAATAAVERWLEAKGFGHEAPDAPANVEDRLRAYMQQAPMSVLPFRLAVCLMTCRGQLELAADAAEQAARLAPHNASVLMQLGVSAARVRRWAVAEGAYSRLAMELEPFSPAAWEGIGRCLDAAGRPAAAMLCYLVALQIVREAAGVWDRLAMSAVAIGHPELAEVADTRDIRLFKQRAAEVMSAEALSLDAACDRQPFEPVLRRAWRLLRFRARFPVNAAHVVLDGM